MQLAIAGAIPWTAPVSANPTLLDITEVGHAAIRFDGDRAPSIQNCVGCKAITSLAWRISPINFTVAACCGDCVADRIEKEWAEHPGASIFLRRRGDVAEAMCTAFDVVSS